MTEHVFLQGQLGVFPAAGPVRQFMELVCVGLGSNPHLSVSDKLDHIRWFQQFFREKQSLVNASLDPAHRMELS